MSNCTTALHLALLALGVGAGRRGHHGQPLVHRHRQRGPLLRGHAGVRGHRPDDVQHRPGADRGGDHRPDTKAILASTRSGMPCDLAGDPRRRRARTGCPSSRTPPARSAARSARTAAGSGSAGRTATVACFSFHPRKVITTGDGGMLTTDDAELDDQFRLLRQHGMSVTDTVRHGAEPGRLRGVPRPRLQLPDDRHPGGGRPRAAQAAARHRRSPAPRLADRYGELLADVAGVEPPFEPAVGATTGRATPCACPTTCDQRAVMQPCSTTASRRAGASCAPTASSRTSDDCRLPGSEWAQDRTSCCRCSRRWTTPMSKYVVEALSEIAG